MNRFLFEDDELTQNPMMAVGGSDFKEPVAQSLAPKPDVSSDVDLKALTDAARSKKAWLNAGANVADALLNTRSAAEIMLGQSRLNNNYGRGLREAADSVQDPVERQRKAFEYVKMRREKELGEQQDALLAEKKDPNSNKSKAAKQLASRFGIQVTPEMSAYDVEQFMDPKKMMEAEAQSRVSFDNNVALEGLKHRNDMQKLYTQNAATRDLKLAEAQTPKGQFDRLPEDKKLTISELAKKNAAKVAIKNQIDAVMNDWDSLSEDQKIARGGALLKTLNSAEGADAIGAEEAARLGYKLEFAMGNLSPFNNKPIQFGRDLKGFAEQARGTAKSMGDAVSANQRIIDESYGRPVQAEGAPTTKQTNMSHPKSSQAVQWALNNPGDPRAQEILKRNGVSLETAIGKK